MAHRPSTALGRSLVWPLTVGTAVALAFSNGCSSHNGSSSGSSSDGGGSSGSGSSGTGSSSDGSSGAGSSGSRSSSASGIPAGSPDAGGVPGGQPGPGVTVAGCEVFPPDNPWNTMIDGADVGLNHAYDANIPQGTELHPDFGGFSTQGYGIPYNVVPATQALEDVEFSRYASESDPGPNGWIGANPVMSGAANGETMYPFFTGMHIEGNPMAGGTPGSLPGDQHALVLSQGASGCKVYEAWQCVAGGGPPFQCANGAVFDLTSNALRPAGWTSADAAGLSIFAGLVKLSEVKAGAIHHAIRVTFNNIALDYIYPATHAAGHHALPDPPMGLRLRLKAGVDISSYTVESQTIMTAMKTYGLIIADIGSDWFFSGDSNDGWLDQGHDGKDKLIYEITSDFANLHGSDFEAIQSGKAVNTGL